jgi:hypothetical protein
VGWVLDGFKPVILTQRRQEKNAKSREESMSVWPKFLAVLSWLVN